MKTQVVGLQSIGFTSQSGDHIEGVKLYVVHPQEGVVGMKADSFFIKNSVEIPNSLKADSLVELYFNPRGKVEKIELVTK